MNLTTDIIFLNIHKKFFDKEMKKIHNNIFHSNDSLMYQFKKRIKYVLKNIKKNNNDNEFLKNLSKNFKHIYKLNKSTFQEKYEFVINYIDEFNLFYLISIINDNIEENKEQIINNLIENYKKKNNEFLIDPFICASIYLYNVNDQKTTINYLTYLSMLINYTISLLEMFKENKELNDNMHYEKLFMNNIELKNSINKINIDDYINDNNL